MGVMSSAPTQGNYPVAFDGQADFSGGQASAFKPSLIQPNQAAEIKNAVIDYVGSLVTRRGHEALGTKPTSSRVQGLFYFDTPSIESFLQVADSALYSFDGSAWGTAISGYAASSSTLQIEFAQMADYVYWVDGDGLAHRYDGTTVQDSTAWGSAHEPTSGHKFCVGFQNRIAWAGASTIPQTLEISDILDPETKSASSVEISKGDGDEITGLCAWKEQYLIVGKQRSIWAVDISQGVGANATLKPLHSNIGCVAHRTMRQCENDILFLARDGVRSVAQIYQLGETAITPPLSTPIRDFINRINKNAWHLSCATSWGGYYMLSVPLDSATTPDTTLVYDLNLKQWVGYWTGIGALCYAESAFSGIQRLNIGVVNGRVLRFLDYVASTSETTTTFQDDGVDIETKYVGRGLVHGDESNQKVPMQMMCEFFASTANIDFGISCDLDDVQWLERGSRSYSEDGIMFPLTFPITFPKQGVYVDARGLRASPRCKVLQVVLRSTSKKMNLKSAQVGSIVLGVIPA